MKPAMTAKEWAQFWSDGKSSPLTADIQRELVAKAKSGHHHAAAALALYAHSFGFTREDVKILEDAIGNVFQIHGEWGVGSIDRETDPELIALQSLADRIEALLPPEG